MFNIKLHNYVRYEKNEYKSLFLTKNNPTDLVNELNKEPYNIDELVKLENRKNERLNHLEYTLGHKPTNSQQVVIYKNKVHPVIFKLLRKDIITMYEYLMIFNNETIDCSTLIMYEEIMEI